MYALVFAAVASLAPTFVGAAAVPVLSAGEIVRILAIVGISWMALLALLTLTVVAAAHARTRARRARLAAGEATFRDVADLMRDRIDVTGAPYGPQRTLLSHPLVRADTTARARLLVAWIQAGQPVERLITYRQAGFSDDQIARHASGLTPINPDAAETLAALRTPLTHNP